MADTEDWNDWAGNDQLQVPHISPQADISLPSYIKAPCNINQDDLQYLWDQGALNIPDTSLKNALLLTYIDHVHPSLPLINLHELLATTSTKTRRRLLREDRKISLLLFQAIMFAGSAFVDQLSLQMAGYSSRRQARSMLYQKVKLLYELNYEIEDKLSIIQSLLLMTYWHEKSPDGKDEWHWLGIAISTTTSLQNRAAIVDLNPRDQKVWNRVWWCCFTRDRFLSFGLRRNPRIEEDKGDSFTTPTLGLDDFDIAEVDVDKLNISLSACRIVQDTTQQLQLVKTFIAKAELCVCIGHVLRTQYYPRVFEQRARSGSSVSGRSPYREALLPNPKADGFEACAEELAEWLQRLPPGMLHTQLTVERLATDGTPLVIEKAVIHTVYLAILSTLHRPRALSQDYNESQAASSKIIRDAAADITSIYMDLYKHNLIRFLPTTAVTVLLPAIISHIQSIKTADNGTPIWIESMNGLAQCMEILQKLRDNYQPADESMHILEQAMKHANIEIPMDLTSNLPAGNGMHDEQMHSVETLDEFTSMAEPETFEFWQAPSPEGASRRYASALQTISIVDSDYQALDPAVSILSKELAWLDDAFAGT